MKVRIMYEVSNSIELVLDMISNRMEEGLKTLVVLILSYKIRKLIEARLQKKIYDD